MNTISPESVGLSSARLKRVDQVMQKYVDQGQLPGVLSLVARRGQVAHLSLVGCFFPRAGVVRPHNFFLQTTS